MKISRDTRRFISDLVGYATLMVLAAVMAAVNGSREAFQNILLGAMLWLVWRIERRSREAEQMRDRMADLVKRQQAP